MTETDAWVEWAKSEEGVSCFNTETLKAPAKHGEYLQNRLWRAFTAGMEAGKKIEQERIVERFRKAIRE